MIPAKIFLIYIDLFRDQNSFQIVAADQRVYEQRPNMFNENRCVIGVLGYPLRLKCLVAKPLFKTQLDMFLYKTVIHCRNWEPKLKAARHF